MSIVILKWNPSFSSYTMARFLNDLEKSALANNGNVGMNWSIWDADKVKTGDVCFLLKVGYGQTGITARGTITSDPYSGEDWAWRNRPTMYCDFDFETMINPDAYPLLNSAELTKAIPDFDWYGGHSGIVLTEKQGDKLERLWHEYMQSQAPYFEKASDQNLFINAPFVSTDEIPYTVKLESGYNGHNIYIKAQEGDITTKLTVYNYHRFLGKFGVKSWRALKQLIIEKYPTVSALRELCADLFCAKIEFNVDFYKLTGNDDEDDN
ncbi:MAG: hypothetical protein K2M19_03745 [Muribaculaceae bacterium]|nr:hypothetical protein [Muribaculaceae bacterium]